MWNPIKNMTSPNSNRVGSENRVTLCNLPAFVDESAEAIMPKVVEVAVGR